MSFEENVAIGKAFYDEKKATGDYHEHPSGYLYRFITEGQTGKGKSNDSSQKPGPTEKVCVHYEGMYYSNWTSIISQIILHHSHKNITTITNNIS